MDILLTECSFFIFIYLFCFLGALSKDLVDTFLEKAEDILILKIIISSLAVTILLYGFSDRLLNTLSFKPFTALCYTMGLISFEVLVKYSSMKNIGGLVEEVYRIKWDKNKDKG
ncbi:hypothetical protein Amet_0858 [Alkaliphilus metalliredigens QYMF]|uniref:Uncharacterized protein n=1 Tax=Alkaliphilus metalliredigens (strain QYMF) TaxID=293826 RepID=A6TLL5_ALKMQ|nr:hypothetical protein [Alkaliphilus metalliredigens]ABR47083.1 hypothetical protein Amet_0858 [Alkaliphilus metalliredigens QYMF]